LQQFHDIMQGWLCRKSSIPLSKPGILPAVVDIVLLSDPAVVCFNFCSLFVGSSARSAACLNYQAVCMYLLWVQAVSCQGVEIYKTACVVRKVYIKSFLLSMTNWRLRPSAKTVRLSFSSAVYSHFFPLCFTRHISPKNRLNL
jgi:hypothetical protein